MTDWYDTFRKECDKGAPQNAGQTFGRVAQALFGADIPSERQDMMFDGEPSGGDTLFRFRLRWLLVVIVPWILGYISGAFPYLGTYTYNLGNGDITYSLQTPTPRIMPLFKRQTAFIDYTIDSRPGFDGNVMLDIRPWPGHANSPNAIVISGKRQGPLEVPITTTDYYQFSFTTMPMARNQEMSYTATWGAR